MFFVSVINHSGQFKPFLDAFLQSCNIIQLNIVAYSV